MRGASFLTAVDRYVTTTTPVVPVPQGSTLRPLEWSGHRYLVGCDGMYVEYRRAWCHGVMALGKSALALPFGRVQSFFRLTCGPVPRRLLTEFTELARRRCPNEVAAWVVWDAGRAGPEAWKLMVLPERSVGPEHVEVQRPVLEEGLHLVVDLHSHGCLPAGFSAVDDADDAKASEVVLAGVVGEVDKAVPSTARRLCVMGTFHPFGESL